LKGQLRRAITVLAPVVLVLAAAVLALALSASPASAFDSWAHDGATGCVCHDQGAPTDATCVTCHSGFRSYPGQTCWSCHAPGQDTSTLSAPSSACSQECHLWNSVQKTYLTPTTHGANPHLGATSACLECHPTSPGIANPGSSPHHSGQAAGFTECGVCHSSLQKHAGKIACTTCHADATAFHLYQASSPGFKKCGSCHSMKHAGKKISASKCASCHKGSGGVPAQHSSSVTKKYVCSGCHRQKLHARSFSSAITSCRSCHGGKYHARQKLPGKSTCTRCHTAALHHANGFQCKLCHGKAIHNTRPSATN
jgi:hypothetical protein